MADGGLRVDAVDAVANRPIQVSVRPDDADYVLVASPTPGFRVRRGAHVEELREALRIADEAGVEQAR